MDLIRVHNTSDTVESGHYLYVVPTGKFVHTWSLVGRQVSKSILDQAKMGSGEEEGKFHDSTTTPECSEDRTAVPSVVKMESELCICTQHVSTPHTLF